MKNYLIAFILFVFWQGDILGQDSPKISEEKAHQDKYVDLGKAGKCMRNVIYPQIKVTYSDTLNMPIWTNSSSNYPLFFSYLAQKCEKKQFYKECIYLNEKTPMPIEVYKKWEDSMLYVVQAYKKGLDDYCLSLVSAGYIDYYQGYVSDIVALEKRKMSIIFLDSLIQWSPNEEVKDTIDSNTRSAISHIVSQKTELISIVIQFRKGQFPHVISLNQGNKNEVITQYWCAEIEKRFLNKAITWETFNDMNITIEAIFYHNIITTKRL